MKKKHLILKTSIPNYIRTACGWGMYHDPLKKFLTKDYKEVTCGHCKRTHAYFEERNKNE